MIPWQHLGVPSMYRSDREDFDTKLLQHAGELDTYAERFAIGEVGRASISPVR